APGPGQWPSTTYVLDLTYEPPTLAETSASAPVYTGTIANQATATPDATYTFVRDMTGITVTVGALRAVTQAIAAPVGEDFPQFVTETPNDPFSGGSFLTGPWR